MDRILTSGEETIRANFNRRPFAFHHALASHPLLTLASLAELAGRLPRASIEYNAGDLPISLDGAAPGNGLGVDETIRGIEVHNSWMVLQNVEQDARFHSLVDASAREIARAAGVRASDVRQPEGYIFVSSAHAVTPYHMDPEHGFLLQIAGTKTMTVHDGADRAVVSDEDLESFYSGVRTRYIPLREHARACAFQLTPGDAVHIPVTFPHYVEVGGTYSISLSITFRTPDLYRRADAYYMNGFLRRRGGRPFAPGRSVARDAIKQQGAAIVRRLRRWRSERQN
jgi:hypothetical protein